MSARKIDFYFNSSESLRGLARAARQIDDLQQILAKSAPPDLAKFCYVKQLRAGVLTLLADNAAIATQLKRLSVRLLASYQKQGDEVTSIRIEVQVCNSVRTTVASAEKKRLSIETNENIKNLATQQEPSPLNDALTRLATPKDLKN